MKLEATRLTEAQRCEIIIKLSKPNAPSKWALGGDYEVSEGAIRKVLKMMRIEEKTPINDEIYSIKTFAESESATDFKGFKALHNTILNIDNQLLCSDVQTEAGHMYDELWWSLETFKWNVNKPTLNVKCKIIMHSRQMTLHDMLE